MPKLYYHAPDKRLVIALEVSKNYDCGRMHIGLEKMMKTRIEKLDKDTYNAYKKMYEG